MQTADDSHHSDSFTYSIRIIYVFYKILSIAHILQQKPIDLCVWHYYKYYYNTINIQALVLSLKTSRIMKEENVLNFQEQRREGKRAAFPVSSQIDFQ